MSIKIEDLQPFDVLRERGSTWTGIVLASSNGLKIHLLSGTDNVIIHKLISPSRVYHTVYKVGNLKEQYTKLAELLKDIKP